MTGLLSIGILIATLAGVCAAVAGYVLAPSGSGHPPRRRELFVIGLLFPIGSLALYVYLGNPYVPASPAALESDGPRFEKRQLALKEREIMADMARSEEYPTPQAFGRLAATQAEQGAIDRALLTLQRARATYPESRGLNLQTGYLYYVRGMKELRRGQPQKAFSDLEAALAVMPEDSEFYKSLKADFKQLENELAKADDHESGPTEQAAPPGYKNNKE